MKQWASDRRPASETAFRAQHLSKADSLSEPPLASATHKAPFPVWMRHGELKIDWISYSTCIKLLMTTFIHSVQLSDVLVVTVLTSRCK